MNALFKKYFWAVNLVAIAALAWTAAGTVNSVAEGALFVVPAPPSINGMDASSAGLAMLGRVPVDDEAKELLVERNVFDLNPREDELAATDGDDDEGEKSDSDDEGTPDGEYEESSLPFDLMGTLVSPDAEASMATVNIDGSNKLAWVGSEFLDGKAKIVAINPRHVIVQEGTNYTVVKLWGDKGKGKGKGAKGSARDRSDRGDRNKAEAKKKPVTNSKPGRADYSKGVKKTGPYDYELDRSMLDEQLKDLTELGSQARVVPNYRNGKYEGFKLVGVRPGSLYRAIGIRSGDVIKAVNGKSIDSPNKALDLFEQLKSSNAIDLAIERRGQPKNLNYSIK